MRNKARVIPFTPAELMELHGLTVENGLKAGYPVVGHRWENTKLNDKKSHRGAATPSAAKINNTIK